jgi:hypothetical protein
MSMNDTDRLRAMTEAQTVALLLASELLRNSFEENYLDQMTADDHLVELVAVLAKSIREATQL